MNNLFFDQACCPLEDSSQTVFADLFGNSALSTVNLVLAQTNMTPALLARVTKMQTGIPLSVPDTAGWFKEGAELQEQSRRLLEIVLGLPADSLELPASELTEVLCTNRVFMYELLDEAREKHCIFLYECSQPLTIYCIKHGLQFDSDHEEAHFLPDMRGISLTKRMDSLKDALMHSGNLFLDPSDVMETGQKSYPFWKLQVMKALEPYVSLLGKLSVHAENKGILAGRRLMDLVLSAVADAFGFEPELMKLYDSEDLAFRKRLSEDIEKHMAEYLCFAPGESGSEIDIPFADDSFQYLDEEPVFADGSSGDEEPFSEWLERKATKEQLLSWAYDIAEETYAVNSCISPEFAALSELVVPLDRYENMILEQAYKDYLFEIKSGMSEED